MVPVLALALSLLSGASLEGELSARVEARSSSIQQSGSAARENRDSGSATPRAQLVVESIPARLTLGYSPRFWTSDFAARPKPLVNQTADARVDLQPDSGWRATLSVSGLRGVTDPLAGWQQTMAVAPESVEVQTTRPIRYEELRALASAEASLSERTGLSLAGGWNLSRAPDPEGRAVLPPQRTASLEAAVGHRLTDLDTLRLSLRGTEAATDLPGADVRVSTMTAQVTWRRLMTPTVEGRFAGGVSLAYAGSALPPDSGDLLWTGEAGVRRAGGETGAEFDIAARLTTFAQRLTGEIDSMASLTGTMGWRVGQSLAFSGTAAAGSSTDGETFVGRVDLRLIYAIDHRIALEFGLNGTSQRERRPERPSFREGSAFLAMAWTTEGLVRLGNVERVQRQPRPNE